MLGFFFCFRLVISKCLCAIAYHGECGVKCRLAFKIGADGAAAVAGRGGNIRNGGLMKAFFSKEPFRRFQNLRLVQQGDRLLLVVL